jgi:hypothetical protein
MRNGDISNETPPRIIVVIDTVANSSIEDVKGILKFGKERQVGTLNHLALSKLWNVAEKFGLSVELAAFEDEYWTQAHLDKFMDKLDRRGANPFNYAELYSNIDDFIGELPYRANLKGVIDLRERVARYGSWGIELENL